MTRAELYEQRALWYRGNCRYSMRFYNQFKYEMLSKIMQIRRPGRGSNASYNDVVIMADTETSKQALGINSENHIVAWTISIRAFHKNLVTLYGNKPSEMMEAFRMIHEAMDGEKTVIYFHNMSYDYVFLRQYLFKWFGIPENQLNTKPHYPIAITFSNGIILKDSLILSQKSLEKWANDLGVQHKKAVGFWDYDLIRNQDWVFSKDELKYIENDTLAGVECIDAYMMSLKKTIATMPYTATGIPREQLFKRSEDNRGHDWFNRLCLTFEQYIKFTRCFHGGFTHGNRHLIDALISVASGILSVGEFVKAYDFASSYPFCMLAYKYACEKFHKRDDCSLQYIVEHCENYAYSFKLIMVRPRLKQPDNPMPALQFSKCIQTINPILDNGRILAADYIEIYLLDPDAEIVYEAYESDFETCVEVEVAAKDYLPRWFTDYIFECFENKTKLKGGDKTNYAIAKSVVNSLYGMTAQRNIRENIAEDYETGEYYITDSQPEEEYEKYLNKRNSFLPYHIGCYVTSYAFRNIHRLIKLCETPIYCDTDSCYGINWDEEAVRLYNDNCKELLIANGYGPVIHKGKEYWLGVATSEGDNDIYDEFKVMGAKRYCGRCRADGELHITVAGVPKRGAVSLRDDINNFTKGTIFPGTESGKLLHTYYFDDMRIDSNGNEVADSISLDPCDYLLDAVQVVDWEKIFYEEVEIQTYEYDELLLQSRK